MSKSIVTQYQPSITEWFTAIGEVEQGEEFKQEDNTRAERFEVLYQTIGLPYERPEIFEARELIEQSPGFLKILQERGDQYCSLRLVPEDSSLPKFRQRGLTLNQAYQDWFFKQDIDSDKYIAQIYPHDSTLLWSASFVVNQEMIFGEVTQGLHVQLSHGETQNPVYRFQYDFSDWQWQEYNQEAGTQVKNMVNALLVVDLAKQKELKDLMNANFISNYLSGYFEAIIRPSGQMDFLDYNRVIPRYILTPPPFLSHESSESLAGDSDGAVILKGMPVYSGVVQGKVVIVKPEEIGNIDFPVGSILVCDNTDVRYLPLMKKAAAIVTDRGGMLSHASITARELKKLCIVGTSQATKVLKNGDIVEVDATTGKIKIIKS